ncbi:unnamed protein product [Bursaphelenchus okinawaensis]|uniref:Nuclear pore complex protein Nup153 n=1 Tax=Bursaphelenchus okinawaensis TaxID=465554 RepID=A0A811JU17_9BILA|nr:unnamed protein product [Bursaphelenchus okinawaensis]CAG9083801.1 unnamed protein product [Bursaphelenchus okinawaensis]
MSSSWTSNLFSFVTGSRKRRAQPDNEEEHVIEPAISKKARADPKLNESLPASVSSFTYRLPTKNTTLNESILSTTLNDTFTSKPPVLDLRHKIKAPSRTKAILAELTKFSSSPNSSKNNLHLFEVNKWTDSADRNPTSLPPRRSTFTPSRINQISASMHRTLKANRSSWNASILNDTSANGSKLSSMWKKDTTSSESNNISQESDISVPNKTAKPVEVPATKVLDGPVTNKFGFTDLDEEKEEEDVLFTFEEPVIDREPRREKSESPSPTESSSKSDGKKNLSDSESSSTSAENEDLEIVETKKAEPTPTLSEVLSKAPKVFESEPKVDKWSCKNCLNKNDAGDEVCKGCQYGKDGKKPEPKTVGLVAKIPDPQPVSLSPITAGKLGNQWECPDCMIRNSPDLSECACCQTAKPGGASSTAAPPKPAAPAFKPMTFSADNASLGGLFGAKNGSTSTGISFGVPAAKPAESASTTAPATTTTAALVSFAAPVSSTPLFGASVASTAPSTLNFGITKDSNAPLFGAKNGSSSTGISLGFPASKDSPAVSAPAPTPLFGSQTDTTTAPALGLNGTKDTTTPAFPVFGAKNGTSTSITFGGLSTDSVPKPSNSLPGTTTEPAKTAVATSVFGSAPKSSTSGFDFGSSSLSNTGFNFNGSSKPNASSAAPPFAFGSAPTASTSSSNGTGSLFQFGSNSAAAPASTTANLFAAPTPPTNLFSTPAPAANPFSAAPTANPFAAPASSSSMGAGRKILSARRKMGR